MGKFCSPRVVPRERVHSPKFESRRGRLLRDGCACAARVNLGMRNVRRVHLADIWSWYRVELRVGDHLGRSEELVSRCVECDLAEPESLASLGGSAPGVVDGILSVLVDQLKSTSLGFIAQLKGTLTQQRYKYATVFVGQFSGYTFVYLQKCITSQETMMAKHTLGEQCSMKILHYHTDNGCFVDNAFIADCQAKHQSLSYCRVNTHFQNGIAECCIRVLQEQTRTSMLYAMKKWKKMVLICLWPYTMRHANDVTNVMPRMGEELSPLEKFSGVQVVPKL